MGKKLYTKENISKAETEWLGIPELVVLKTNSDDVGLEVVHRRYFEDEKLLCPACRSSKTRCSKIVDRKLKDLLWLDEDHKTFQIISLLLEKEYIPLPSLETQKKIVTHLDSLCNKIDEVIDEQQRLIPDLEAYKRSLIYETVTGKRKVV